MEQAKSSLAGAEGGKVSSSVPEVKERLRAFALVPPIPLSLVSLSMPLEHQPLLPVRHGLLVHWACQARALMVAQHAKDKAMDIPPICKQSRVAMPVRLRRLLPGWRTGTATVVGCHRQGRAVCCPLYRATMPPDCMHDA